MSWNPDAGFSGPYTANGAVNPMSIEGQMQSMSVQPASAPPARKKKTRHVLDASVGSAPTGFGGSQVPPAAPGNWAPPQPPLQGQTDVQQHPQHIEPHLDPRLNAQQSFAPARHMPEAPSHSAPITNQLDAGQYPSITDEINHAMEHFRTNLFFTAQPNSLNPPANVDFSAVDTGVSNPKFARLSMGSVPASEDLLTASQLPLSMILQPLADLNPTETPVPVVDCTQTTIPRCHRCRAYINPSMLFINGGAKFTCNICGFANETPPEYYSPADVSGVRQDWNMRPELQYGTCDFVVGKDFWFKEREPKPLHILFAIDVSEQSLLRGVPKQTTDAIWKALYGDGPEKLPENVMVGFITFDRACQFYSLSPSASETVQMMYVTDVEDMFLPIGQGLFANPAESRKAIELALNAIGSVFERESVPEPALGALTRAAYLALHATGGKLHVFLGALPTWGPGKLKVRENPALYRTTEERSLYDAANVHWKNVAEEFVGIGVGVDCFLFPSSYIDVATVGTLSQLTGGDLFFYQNFIADRDGPKFSQDLARSLFRHQGSAVQMKIRCSSGLRVETMLGNFVRRGPSDMEMGSLDADKAITCVFKHDGKLDAKSDAFFQSAVLFTTPGGQRRLRIQNVKCPVTSAITEVMRYCDAGAAITTIAKLATLEVHKADLKVVKERVTDQCVRILAAYRKNCAVGFAAGELILPESLKLFPLLTLAVLKQFSFRTDAINSDVRVQNQRLIRSCSSRDLLSLIYPRLVPVHSLAEHEGFADENGMFVMPKLVKNSFLQIDNGGVYIMDNGQSLYLWFKNDTTPALIKDLYGPEFQSLESLQPRSATLPVLDTLLNIQVRNIVAYLNTFSTSRTLVPQITRQSLDGSEVNFAQSLIDDRNCDNMSYPDFLAHVHKRVQVLLAEKAQSKNIGSWISGTEHAY